MKLSLFLKQAKEKSINVVLIDARYPFIDCICYAVKEVGLYYFFTQSGEFVSSMRGADKQSK